MGGEGQGEGGIRDGARIGLTRWGAGSVRSWPRGLGLGLGVEEAPRGSGLRGRVPQGSLAQGLGGGCPKGSLAQGLGGGYLKEWVGALQNSGSVF